MIFRCLCTWVVVQGAHEETNRAFLYMNTIFDTGVLLKMYGALGSSSMCDAKNVAARHRSPGTPRGVQTLLVVLSCLVCYYDYTTTLNVYKL